MAFKVYRGGGIAFPGPPMVQLQSQPPNHPMDAFTANPQIDEATELAAMEDDGYGYENWDDDQALEAYSLECAFGPDF